jgi:uncharacterized protein (DUF3820 family)
MAEYNPDALHDDNKMPFGKYKGQWLKEVPDSYWRWFLGQDWCDEWPELVDYANVLMEE